MKNIFTLLSLLCAIPLLFASCKIEKRVHRPGYHVEWKKPIHRKTQQLASREAKIENEASRTDRSETPKRKESEIQHSKEGTSPSLYADISGEMEIDTRESVLEKFNREIREQEECETLVLTDGRKLEVKLLEISQSEVKYRKCGYPDGPIVIVDKEDVDRVIYANGAVDEISGYSAPSERPEGETRSMPSSSTVQKKTDVLATLSMIFGIVGIFIAGIPLGIAAIIMAGISLGKFAKYPDRFAGKGMAIAGLILGLLAIVGALVVLALLA